MGKSAVQLKPAGFSPAREVARVIDIRTRKPWRRPEARVWPFLVDVLITFSLVMLGAWLFQKMQGG